MDSECNRKKRTTNVEEVDRLSSLPDDVIHKILSFIGSKDAVGTSTLSSRWRYIWTSMSCLRFSSDDFSTSRKFSKFVRKFVSRRNNEIEVSSLDLYFPGKEKVIQSFVKKVLDYAYSHNIQKLNVDYTPHNYFEFPLSLFSSLSLKHLSFTLVGCNEEVRYLPTTSTLELPALTTLYLHGPTLCCDNNSDNWTAIFSKCPNLKNLTLNDIRVKNEFNICHPQLSNLTLENGLDANVINVAAPQLKNLVISGCYGFVYVISAPNLTSLVYDCEDLLCLSTDGFHSLKEANICVSNPEPEHAHEIVSMFQHFHSVKSLKLNLEIVELLSFRVELISHQPSPFANLKSLTIYPKALYQLWLLEGKASMSIEVKNYLLDNSSGVTFTYVSREEVKAKRDFKSAKTHMRYLRVLIEKEKAKTKIKTNRADMKVTKTQGENQLYIGGRVKHVDRCWEDLSSQIEQGREKTYEIISNLSRIKELLKELPTSKREEVQTCFSCLCAEADTVVKNILDDMKIECSGYFRELAQTSASSS